VIVLIEILHQQVAEMKPAGSHRNKPTTAVSSFTRIALPWLAISWDACVLEKSGVPGRGECPGIAPSKGGETRRPELEMLDDASWNRPRGLEPHTLALRELGVHDALTGLVQIMVLIRSSARRAVICLVEDALALVADVTLQHAEIVLLPPCAALSSSGNPVMLRQNVALAFHHCAESLAGFADLGEMAVGRGLQAKLIPPHRLQRRL